MEDFNKIEIQKLSVLTQEKRYLCYILYSRI